MSLAILCSVRQAGQHERDADSFLLVLFDQKTTPEATNARHTDCEQKLMSTGVRIAFGKSRGKSNHATQLCDSPRPSLTLCNISWW